MYNLENLTADERVELYNKISDRNFGIYTKQEQEKIKNGKIGNCSGSSKSASC